MRNDYKNISEKTINDANTVSDSLIEKALAMRCTSYLAQIKAQLLTDTIFEIDSSKKILTDINTRLKHEIQERRQAEEKLKKSKKMAEEATLLKDKFVALVSHDLNNPLGVIKGYLSLLEKDKELSEKNIEIVESALSACGTMTKLINDILNLSRIKNGEIKPVSKLIDVKSIVDMSLENQSAPAIKKGVELFNKIPKNTGIYADEDLMLEVFNNLISNAIKFCNKGDSVSIWLPADREFTIAVSDTGVGMKPDLLKNVFQYETKTSLRGTQGEAGTGFGLPLVYDIVKAHKGDIEVESREGKGTTFYIKLPKVIDKNINMTSVI